MVVRVVDLVPGARSALDMRRADELDAAEFWSEFVCKQKPIIVRGAVENWPAIQKWGTAGYLESISLNLPIRFARTYNPIPVDPFLKYALEEGTLDDFIKETRESSADSTFSIPGAPVPDKWGLDLGDYGILSETGALDSQVYPSRRLFIYKNASTEWHYHVADETLTTQLLGKKRISIFKPDAESWAQYADVIEANFHHLESSSCFFPAGKQVEIFEAEMGPGDVVYVPPFWWHGVDTLDSSLGVTLAHCFGTPVDACRSEVEAKP
jgi:hypothetical protein